MDLEKAAPTTGLLDKLVAAYTRCVPWESVFRIAKRSMTAQIADCPRWPEEFWRDAMERGGGGTCFESNYAFFDLLRALGYSGYLTINDMHESRGCHTAIILWIDDARWLVDVGIPLYVPIPLAMDQVTQRESAFHTYTITPHGNGSYEISRDRHPSPYIFTLIDQPVSEVDYQAAVTRDYASDGHFLTEVIISKVIDEHIWRFNGRERPPLLNSFGPTSRSMAIPIDLAVHLARRFKMEEEVVARALRATGLLP